MPSLRRPVRELLTPAPDGVITDFQTSVPYQDGTVSVWVNGMRRIASWDDGYTLPGSGVISLKEAPQEGDSVVAEYERA